MTEKKESCVFAQCSVGLHHTKEIATVCIGGIIRTRISVELLAQNMQAWVSLVYKFLVVAAATIITTSSRNPIAHPTREKRGGEKSADRARLFSESFLAFAVPAYSMIIAIWVGSGASIPWLACLAARGPSFSQIYKDNNKGGRAKGRRDRQTDRQAHTHTHTIYFLNATRDVCL